MNPSSGRTDPRRGEIWLVDFGDPVGREQGYRRPALVVSADRLNVSRAGLVIVVPVTRTRRDLPSHVEIEPAGAGLGDLSYAKGADIKSISRNRLVHRLGSAPDDIVSHVAFVVRTLIED
ncbi:MAG: type II toxin-antitoxin system PemK/MazF family toxin [Acidimicrobiales bacterium]